ncbi:plasmid maintenance system antidote protein VapI [Paenibacillus sp. 4624]|uniref:hypothetical protein n=1 Tax=Paenibacillus sp. 4624 TaxID=3156453 RepID=UPI003D249B49
MFPNLQAEIIRNGLVKKKMAERIGVSERSLNNKLKGRTEFTRSEMIAIREEYFPDSSANYLFSFGEVQPQKKVSNK